MDENRYFETGPIARYGDKTDSYGNKLQLIIRRVVAEHKRLLLMPHAAESHNNPRLKNSMAGVRRTMLQDGTAIVSWINPFGLVPTVQTRVFAPPPPPGITDKEFLLETGWLTFENRGDGYLPYVYLFPDGLAPFEQFTIVPPTLILDYRSYNSTYDRASYAPVTYSGGSSLLKHRPELYSGLTRLFVQALIGANRTIDDVLTSVGTVPTGQQMARNLGLIRSPEGEYWIVWRTTDIKARKLKLPDDDAITLFRFNRLQNWSGDLSAKDAMLLEASVLAMLEDDPSQSNIVLVASTDTELVKMKESGYGYMPWGMCWRHQARGASDENICGAVWTVFKQSTTTIIYERFKVGKLDITFMEGTPSATLSVDEYVDGYDFRDFLGPRQVFWMDLTTPRVLFTPNTSTSGTMGVIDSIPILSWYGSDGELHNLTFSRHGYELLEHTVSGGTSICGTGSSFRTEVFKTTNGYCNFSLDDTSLIDEDYIDYRQRYYTFTQNTADNGISTFAHNYSTGSHDITGCNGTFHVDGSSQYDLTKYYATTTCTSTVDDYRTFSSDSAIIISDSPGMLWHINPGTPDYTLHSGADTIAETGSGHLYRSVYEVVFGPGSSFDASYSAPYLSFTVTSYASIQSGQPASAKVVNDYSIDTVNPDSIEEIIAWLGVKTGSWSLMLSPPGFIVSPSGPHFQPALGGYVAVKEMFGSNYGTAFDEQAYNGYGTFGYGRLIGGA